MKRILCLVLAAIMCLSLCACSSDPSEAEVLYGKYEALISALEAEDYESAFTQIEAMMPAPPEPVIEEIQISLDNIWDYFEIVEEYEEETDAYGNTIASRMYTSLELKKGLKMANPDEYPTDVSLGYEYDADFTYYSYVPSIDFKTFSSPDAAIWVDTVHESQMLHYSDIRAVYIQYVDTFNGQANTAKVYNFTVLNADGTLYLVHEQ